MLSRPGLCKFMLKHTYREECGRRAHAHPCRIFALLQQRQSGLIKPDKAVDVENGMLLHILDLDPETLGRI